MGSTDVVNIGRYARDGKTEFPRSRLPSTTKRFNNGPQLSFFYFRPPCTCLRAIDEASRRVPRRGTTIIHLV